MTLAPEPLRGLLQRLPEHAIVDRLAGIRGDVRVEVVDPHGSRAGETLRFDGGSVTVVEGVDGPPDVVLRTSPERLGAIVTGEANAGLEYLRGSLDIEGDEDLALAVGGIFRVPGTSDVAVDPRALDPVDVARVLGEVDRGHLEKVMASGFRGVVLGEIFRRLPEFVNPRRAARVDLTVGFRLTGHPSGEVERYVVRVDHGTATVSEGASAGDDRADRDATVTCQGHDFLRLATGHLNPVFGVLRGLLKVRGDQAKALQLSSVIDIPRAR